jgi:imidazoleglycerol phosphate synthase glutamine amidotransferase subunit HisH
MSKETYDMIYVYVHSENNTFISSVQKGRIAASQFHPEKSGFNGLQMLRYACKQVSFDLRQVSFDMW